MTRHVSILPLAGLLLLSASLAGCDSDGAPDGGPGNDAGPGMDSGSMMSDAGGEDDAGADSDAGPMMMADAGMMDAGMTDAGMPDAGMMDAGMPDAGRPDAGRPDAGAPDAGAPDAGSSPGTCTSNMDCLPTEFCQRPVGFCGMAGTCAVRPAFCTFIFAPVCGCDNMTYSNECLARAAGMSIADPTMGCP